MKIKIMGIHHFLTNGVRGHNMDMSGKRRIFVGLFLELICEGADLMGIGNQFMAAFSQRNGVIDSLKQKAVQLFLQLLDLKRNGRLGITQLFCGFCETT